MNKKKKSVDVSIHLRITKREKNMIEKKAMENNITSSEFIRAIMRKSITSKYTSSEQKLIMLQAYVDELIEAVMEEYGNIDSDKIENAIRKLEEL